MEIKEVRLEEIVCRKAYCDQTCGAVYIAGYKNGTVKIGCTKDPWSRYEALKYDAVNYSGSELERFAISNPVEDYTKLEKLLHCEFSSRLVKRELFKIEFDEAIRESNDKFDYFEKHTDADRFADIMNLLIEKLEKKGINNANYSIELCTYAFRQGAIVGRQLNNERGKQGPL